MRLFIGQQIEALRGVVDQRIETLSGLVEEYRKIIADYRRAESSLRPSPFR